MSRKGVKNGVRNTGKCTRCGTTEEVSRYRCKPCDNEITKANNRRLKTQIILHYSNGNSCCECCSEHRIDFLCIDHINGGGSKHRASLNRRAGRAFYYWLKKTGYPEGYRVLCYNCNQGRQLNNGVCPHKMFK